MLEVCAAATGTDGQGRPSDESARTELEWILRRRGRRRSRGAADDSVPGAVAPGLSS